MKNYILIVFFLVIALLRTSSGQTKIDFSKQGKTPNFSGLTATYPFEVGTVLPANCSLGQAFYKADAAPGSNLYVCTSTGTWTIFSQGSVPVTAGQQNKILSNDGSVAVWRDLSGDVSGNAVQTVVGKILGRPLSATIPANGNFLKWNSGFGVWEPAATGVPNYSATFTAATQVAITGSQHGLQTEKIVVACYDNADPAARLEPSGVSINLANFNVIINFATAKSGYCVLNGSGGTASNGVKSVSAGEGIVLTQSAQDSRIAIDSASVPVFVSAVQILNFDAIAPGTCSEKVIPLTGARLGDAVAGGWPPLMPANVLGQMWVTVAGQVSVRVCNFSTIEVPAISDEFRATVVRGY